MRLHDGDIMSVLPDAAKRGDYVSTAEVFRKVEGLDVDGLCRRTVLRHLESLFEAGLVEREKRGNGFAWRKKAGASGMAAKAGSMMTRDEALALQTLKRFSLHQIPALVAQSLSAMFDVAQARLQTVNNDSERRYLRWSDKVAVESGGFGLKCPEIDAEGFSEVSLALFYERKLEIVYRPRSNPKNDKSKIILPLGLVEVGGLVYLVGGTEGKPNPTMYRMDRIITSKMLLDTFEYPRSFVLDKYVKQQRQFDFMVQGEVSLTLRFWDGAGNHLLETPFSNDQQTIREGDYLTVRGTAMLSQRLRWWLRSFGPAVEVMEPASLREAFSNEAHALTDLYR